MLRYLIIEILLPLILFLFVRSIIRSIFQSGSSLRPRQAPPAGGPDVVAGGELKRDPVCGTYVSTSLGWSLVVRGEPVYFCSKECRDKFAA
jgi:YHS domain-containing protein